MSSDEHCLPKTAVNKLIKDNLSPSVRVASDFRDVIAECGVEFIHMIATQAKEVAQKSDRKTLNSEHVMKALEELEFGRYTEDLKNLMSTLSKEPQKKQPDKLTEEEKIKLQQESEQKARMKLVEKYGEEMTNTLLSSLEMK